VLRKSTCATVRSKYLRNGFTMTVCAPTLAAVPNVSRQNCPSANQRMNSGSGGSTTDVSASSRVPSFVTS
jgi:hypothetical protein